MTKNEIIGKLVAQYIDGEYMGLTEFAQNIWNAALSAQAQAAVPPGWVMVPKEPTPEMIEAAEKAQTHHRIEDRKRGGRDPELGFAGTYRAMLYAAPSTVQPSEQAQPVAWTDAVVKAKAAALHVFSDGCNHTADAIEYITNHMLTAAPSAAPVQAEQPVASLSGAEVYALGKKYGDERDGFYLEFSPVELNIFAQDVIAAALAAPAQPAAERQPVALSLPPLPVPFDRLVGHPSEGAPVFTDAQMREYAMLALSQAQAAQSKEGGANG